MQQTDIVIIGAGLSGLTLAYLLQEQKIPCKILEARDRVGGRIFTDYQENEAPIELGATWLGKNHPSLIELLETLGLPLFPQTLGDTAIYEPISTSPPQQVALPPQEEPSFRIAGGSSRLIHTLVEKLPPNCIQLAAQVSKLQFVGDLVEVHSSRGIYQAQKVISTLPPYLLVSTVDVAPALPESLVEIARQTHTWMGESIKVGLRYTEPFWKHATYTGTVFSSVGPLTELYDHSNVEGTHFALKGFLNSAYHATSRKERIQAVQKQLNRYVSPEVKTFSSYIECVWRHEPFTFFPYEGYILPHQNNGNPIFREDFFDSKLIIAGSETSPRNPGYMEGAILSAKLTFEKLVQV
ncbi:MAG: NAD(P)/FAD-dependent oxidoreductase [Bacteroidota bacterium]